MMGISIKFFDVLAIEKKNVPYVTIALTVLHHWRYYIQTGLVSVFWYLVSRE